MYLGRIFRDFFNVSDKQLLEALSNQKHGDHRRIGEILLFNNVISIEELESALRLQEELEQKQFSSKKAS